MTETYTPDNLIAGPFPRIGGSVTILSGNDLARGTVLGRVTKALGTPDASGLVSGDGTLTGASLGARAKIGDYTITCIAAATDGGTFKVVDPDGVRLDDAAVGSAYSSEHIGFTINDGDSDFAVGDAFVVPVEAGSGKCKAVLSTAVDGSAEVYGVLAAAVDASSADAVGPAFLSGEFNESALTFGGSDTADDHRDQARAKAIFFKSAVSA